MARVPPHPAVVPVMAGLTGLPEDLVAQAIVQAIRLRPSLALPVVTAICPELTYAPAKALTDKRAVGWIKSFNHTNGYGFIACPDLFHMFRCDVFLHKAQVASLGSVQVDQQVSFAVLLDRYNRPQAYDLAPISGWPTASQPQSFPAPAPCAECVGASGGFAAPMVPASASSCSGGAACFFLAPEDVDGAAHQAASAAARARVAPCGVDGHGASAASSGSSALPEDVGGGAVQRYLGVVKSFSDRAGFGFIKCPELYARFMRDVFVHQAAINGCQVGMEVEFGIFLNAKGQPQAKDVQEVRSQAGGKMPPAQAYTGRSEVASHRKATDGLFEGATCVICQEILYRATSVQPCLHSFCSACLGSWLWSSCPQLPQCPVCRETVERVTRNTTLDGLIDGLLKAHPERRRPEEELAELNGKDVLQEAGYDLTILRVLRRSANRGAAAAGGRARIWRTSSLTAHDRPPREWLAVRLPWEGAYAWGAEPEEDEGANWWELSDDDGGWSDAASENGLYGARPVRAVELSEPPPLRLGGLIGGGRAWSAPSMLPLP